MATSHISLSLYGHTWRVRGNLGDGMGVYLTLSQSNSLEITDKISEGLIQHCMWSALGWSRVVARLELIKDFGGTD